MQQDKNERVLCCFLVHWLHHNKEEGMQPKLAKFRVAEVAQGRHVFDVDVASALLCLVTMHLLSLSSRQRIQYVETCHIELDARPPNPLSILSPCQLC
jgi:hypothetical protein